MRAAIGDSLPVAVGVLLSPMPVVALVLMLVSRRARRNGTSFVVGWVSGILGVGTVVVLLAAGTSVGSEQSTPASLVRILLGFLLLALAARQWRTRPRHGESAPVPAWMSTLEDFSAVKAFGLGFALSGLNPKNFLLVASGATLIAAATDSGGERAASLAVFTLVASAGVLVVLGIYLVMGSRAAELLDAIKAWLIANNAVVMTVLLLVLGVKVVGDGLAAW